MLRMLLIPAVISLGLLLSAVEEAALSPQQVTIPPAAQPYVEFRAFTSPLTGESFTVPVQTRAAPVASYDYDFCPHPAFNTLAYTLVTDPVTGWTDYPETFSKPSPLSSQQLAELLGEPKFNRQPPDGLPWLNPYPWEQFENAARQAEALKLAGVVVGNWYLQAAYAVRLDVISGDNGFDTEVEAIFGRLPRPAPDPRENFLLPELQLAAAWEQQRSSGVLDAVEGAEFALAQAWLYRSRGELVAAERWLDEASAADSQLADSGGLYSFLRSSIELERGYLQEAQRWMAGAYAKHEVEDRRVGLVALALAEIARRLGDLPAARQWYAEARLRQYGDINLDRLARLEQLASGRGY